jgi:hypothetical protein
MVFIHAVFVVCLLDDAVEGMLRSIGFVGNSYQRDLFLSRQSFLQKRLALILLKLGFLIKHRPQQQSNYHLVNGKVEKI